jgi:outer membrane lipopolysaccharide assembly protein LptE/RlpB
MLSAGSLKDDGSKTIAQLVLDIESQNLRIVELMNQAQVADNSIRTSYEYAVHLGKKNSLPGANFNDIEENHHQYQDIFNESDERA